MATKPKVIAITNQKGGIGKTTTAIAIASILHKMGHKTLLIDADAQCNSSDTFHAKIDGSITLYDVLLENDRVDIKDAVQHTEYGDIIAGDPILRRADNILSADPDGPFKLAESLGTFDDSAYEYIIIDTAPALGELTKSALIAADKVIIPLSADRYAIKGLSDLVQSIYATKKRFNPGIEIAGLLLVAYPERTKLGKQIMQELKGVSDQLGTKIFTPPIRRTIKINEAHSNRKPLIYYDDKCTAAQDYMKIVDELIVSM